MEKVMKYSCPTKYDMAPYSTMWRAHKDNDECDVFIQVSEIIQEPTWINIGTFLEKSFEEQLENENFIDDCLKRYKKNVRL